MLRLTRIVRFAVNPPPEGASAGGEARVSNGFAGVPGMVGLGRHYELTVTCEGEADPVTGYFLGIQEIDRAARATAIPVIAHACLHTPHAQPQDVLARAVEELQRALGGIVRTARWNLSPFYSVEVNMPAERDPTQPPRAVLRQKFEFAAAHRLHTPSLSDEENRRLFGKCNHPGGHGHNYVLEPAVSLPLGPEPAFTLANLELAVDGAVLRVMDHKHLNVDVPEFRSPGGLNPSVENIAKVCFDRLAPVVDRMSRGAARLRDVTVWETEKTSCTYPSEPPRR